MLIIASCVRAGDVSLRELYPPRYYRPLGYRRRPEPHFAAKDAASPVAGFTRAAEEIVEFARAKGVNIITTVKAFNTDDDE